MGKSTKVNLETRFGSPMRIRLIPSTNKDLCSIEDRYQKEIIFEAYCGILKGLLGVDPGDEVVFGNASLEGKFNRTKKRILQPSTEKFTMDKVGKK